MGWWWCRRVVVVGERTCRGVCSVEIEKGEKNLFFFVSFLHAVGMIPDGSGIHRLPRCYVGHLFGWGVCL
jgi:hypothetical protein